LSRGNPHSSILVRVISRNKITLDDDRKDIDNRAEILTIVGYAKQYACGVQSFAPAKSCTITDMPNGTGACWKTNYDEYRCHFVSVGGNGYELVPPPTAN